MVFGLGLRVIHRTMSFLTGWFKSTPTTETNAATSSTTPTASASATNPAVESANEIRERRLAKLSANTALAAAAVINQQEEKEGGNPSGATTSNATPIRPATATVRSQSNASPSTTATTASSNTSAAVASPATPVVRPQTAVPTKTLSAPSPSAGLKVSPPSSPLAVPNSPARKPVPVSPLANALSLTSLAPVKPGIQMTPQAQYAALRSPLPPNLLLSYSGNGITQESLLRAFENAAFSDIFGVRVTDPTAKASQRTFLPGLADELATSVTLDKQHEVKSAEEFEEEPMLIHRAHLDTLVMERLAQFQSQPAPVIDAYSSSSRSHTGGSFTWMIAAYRRALIIDEKLNEGLTSATTSGATSTSVFPTSAAEYQACLQSITMARTCLVRYIGLLLSDEDLFQTTAHRAAARAECMKLLCSDHNVARTLPSGLFESLVQTYQTEESFNDIFKPLTDQLSVPLKFAPSTSRLGEVMPLMEDACRILLGLIQIFRFQSTAKLVISHPSWLPKVPNGRMLMTISTLGPLLSLCTAETEPSFHEVLKNKPRDEIESDIVRLRTSFASYQSLLTQLFKNGLKHPVIRESFLQWFAVLITSNIPRRRMQFHPFEVSSNGVFYNSMHVALKLSQPIIKKATKADFEKVNLQYLLQGGSGPGLNARIDYDSITRVQATLADVKAMRGALAKPILYTPNESPYSPFNFVTEMFFLTHEILHEGLGPTVRQYTELMQQIARDSRQLQHMDPQAIMYGQLQSQLDAMFAINLATRVHLQDMGFIQDVIAFYDWSARWIRFHQLEVENGRPTTPPTGATPASPNATNSSTAVATTSTSTPATSSSSTTTAPTTAVTPARPLSLSSLIPEPIIDDIVEFFIYLGRFQSEQLRSLPSSSYAGILDLILALSAGPFALKNPHLRGSLAEFLLMLIPVDHTVTPDHIFNTHPGMLEKLIPSLLELYVSVEDGRGMYYQKFTARNQISTILECLWQLPTHKQKLIEVANSNGLLFTKFINVLANDLIFLLDEGLKELIKIREFQLEMEDEEKWSNQASDTRAERERAFHQSEQGATSLLTLANATVHMLFYLTAEIVAPFVAPEFVERMAHMLDYYIMQLVGPKISDLKVKNREKYAFKPRDLLQEIIGIWLQLAHEKEFLNKVAADERSYRPSLFAKAGRIMRNRAIMAEKSVQRFEQLNREVQELSENLLALDEILGEIPDEYQDVMMGTLMEDPVQLPQSKQILDRANIKRQLMNKKVDPFSNTPLTEDMLIEKPELKAEILRWIDERKLVWKNAKKAENEAAEAAAATGNEEEDEPTTTAASSSTVTSASTSGPTSSTASSMMSAASQPTTEPTNRRSYLDDDDE